MTDRASTVLRRFGWTYVALSMLVGVGNGLPSGVLMTLGADLAPRPGPSAFLGAWRTLGLLGAAAFVRWIPRYVPVTIEPTRTAP